jgi:hypothetical protein
MQAFLESEFGLVEQLARDATHNFQVQSIDQWPQAQCALDGDPVRRVLGMEVLTASGLQALA